MFNRRLAKLLHIGGDAAFAPIRRSLSLKLTPPFTLETIALQTETPTPELEDIATKLQLEDTTFTTEEVTKILAVLNKEANVEVRNRLGKSTLISLSTVKQSDGMSGDKLWPLRPPVVTVMGHVDHGKTTLLDALRRSNVAANETGGITQHLGAFTVTVPEFPGSSITFLDTPGHAAFTEMRRRGANVTDIVVLVIAADDGIMPQTVECIQIIKEAQLPVIVAITKADLVSNNSPQFLLIMKELARYDIIVEPMGGSIQIVTLSSKTRKGLSGLLAAIAALGEQLELKAPGPEEGPFALVAYVLEAKVTQSLGPTATLLLRAGSLSVGALIACSNSICRVKTISGSLKTALPSQAVEVSGWKSLPAIGSRVRYLGKADDTDTYEDIKAALQYLDSYDTDVKEKRISPNLPCLKIMLFCDVSGSIEPISRIIYALGKNPKVKTRIIRASVGHPTQWDIEYAKTAEAMIVVFNIKENAKVMEYAANVKQKIHSFLVVYELAAKLKELMEKMLPPIYIETKTATARVKQVFNIEFTKSKGGKAPIAGCIVEEGTIKNQSSLQIRIKRRGELVYSGGIKEIKIHKETVKSVSKGKECGIHLEPRFDDLQEGDEVHQVFLTPTRDTIEFATHNLIKSCLL